MFKSKRSLLETVLMAGEGAASGGQAEGETEDQTEGEAEGQVEGKIEDKAGAEGEGGEEGEAAGTAAAAEATAAAEKNKAPEWAKRRIDAVTAKWRGSEEQLAAKVKEIELLSRSLEEALAKDPNATKGLSDAEIEKKANELADTRVRQKAWNDACEKVYEDGKSAFKDWDTTLKNYSDIGGLPANLISAALETEAPHEVLYALAGDLNEASRVLTLSPAKLAITLDRMATKLQAAKTQPPKEVSKAPKPATAVNGRSTVEADPEKMSMKEWIAWREGQVEKNRKNGRTVW